ncbi:MAG: hypothetical protein ACLGHD_06445, partial [Actinomycetes bacterium]
GSNPCAGANGEPCRYYQLNWQDLRPGNYQFSCHNTASNGGAQFQSGTVSVGSLSGSTQNRANGDKMCYSGFAGDAWMQISGGPDNVNLSTPRVRWP